MTKIILDACNNHLGHDEIIVEMIREAKRLGADYIKFQLYDPESLNIIYPNYSDYKSQLEKCQITEGKLRLILNETFKSKIRPMFTLFSQNRIPFLQKELGTRNDYAIKIASADMLNATLIQRAYSTFNAIPFFVSCGMHTKLQIKGIRENFNNTSINWLYCVSMYPTPLKFIDFDEMVCFDGFSDHTKSIDGALRALSLEVGYLEMHFTLGRSLPCKDSIVSKIPSEIEQVVHFRDYLASVDKYKGRFVERRYLQ